MNIARRMPLLLVVAMLAGCQSPYHADQGALFGGVTGAGVGALVGSAVGDPAAGALIGAGVGAVSGAAVGSSLDEIEARNRAEIAAHMGTQIPAGAVTMADVVNMTHAGVSEQLIVTHVQRNGMVAPLSSQDLIALKQQGVSDGVIAAMQTMPPPQRVAAVPVGPPRPVVVEEYYYGGPYWGPYCGPHWRHRHWHHHHHPHASFGVSIAR